MLEDSQLTAAALVETPPQQLWIGPGQIDGDRRGAAGEDNEVQPRLPVVQRPRRTKDGNAQDQEQLRET